jgi:hypothetical protein
MYLAHLLGAGGSPNWAEKLTAHATLGAAIVAFAAALIALLAFFARGLQTRQTRAHSYLERYNGHLHIEPRNRLHRFFTIDPEEKSDRIKRWEEMDFREQLLTVQELNFWEELSGMYNRNLVDRPIIDDYFGSEAIYTWEKIEWFVDYQRGSQCNAMRELEHMCEQILRQRENFLEPALDRANTASAEADVVSGQPDS